MLKKIVITSLFLCLFLFCPNVFAENGSGADFGVQPVYPDNQQNGEVGYYNLKVEPDTKQIIQVKITNYSDKENTIKMRATRATTSDGGVISYKEFDKEKDDSIVNDFNDIVKIKEDTVVLLPLESKEVSVELEMPKENYTGEILGGLHFFKENEFSEENQSKTVINTFSYSIPIVLKENEDALSNQLAITKTEATQRNYHNYVETTIQNKEATIINKMIIDGEIRKKGSDKTLYTRTEENYKMAPNSTLNFGFDLNDTPLKAGNYIVSIKIEIDDEKFILEDEFEISKEVAQKLNKESVYLEEPSNYWLMGTIICLLFIIVILSIILVVKNKKRKAKNLLPK